MPRYDEALFSPAAPVVRIKIYAPDSNTDIDDVPMLLDSGADVTLLPKAYFDRLGIEATAESYEQTGFDGNSSVSSAVRVHLVFLGKTFRGQFLLIDQEYGILGRNVLNNLHLTLNGPQLQWEVR